MTGAPSDPELRLATYGTLAPGRINAHQLADLAGTWSRGTVRGRLVEAGWGAAHGYPGMILDAAGEEIEVHIFTSSDLPAHWPRLDAFEGDGYRRVAASVSTPEGLVAASVYEIKR